MPRNRVTRGRRFETKVVSSSKVEGPMKKTDWILTLEDETTKLSRHIDINHTATQRHITERDLYCAAAET
jgi:hypothetical protein